MILAGLAILVASKFLREELAGSALALGCGLVLIGLAFDGFKGLLAGFGKSKGSGNEPGA
jgi:hypothetical protein